MSIFSSLQSEKGSNMSDNKLDFNLDFLDNKSETDKNKYCSKCGEKTKPDDTFCYNCGNKLTTEHKVEESKVDDKTNSKGNKNVEYAGFWIRLGAYAIDILGMAGGAVVVWFVLSVLFGEEVYEWPDIVAGYFGYVIYSTFTLTIWSTTFGKYLYGLKVETESSNRLNFGRALKRSLLQPLSTVLFGIGYWNMNKNPKKQAWHDKRANTVVVRERKSLALAYIVTIIAVIIWAYLYSLEQ